MPVAGRALVVLMLALLLAPAGARAQPETMLGAGAIVPPDGAGAGMAWLVLGQSAEGVDVLHLPARDGVGGMEDGLARLAVSLRAAPRFIAARGERVYLVFETPTGPAFEGKVKPRPRQVLSMAGVVGSDGRWTTIPDGRLTVEISLPGEGTLLGVAGSDVGLFALHRQGDEVRLLELRDDGWQALPDPVPPGASRLFGVRGGVGVVSAQDTGVSIGLGLREGAGDMRWAWASAEGAAGAGALAGHIAYASGQVVIAADAPDGSVVLLARTLPWSTGGWREIARTSPAPGRRALCALDGSGRVILITPSTEPDAPRALPEAFEVSVASGRVFYAGQLRLLGPVGRADVFVLLVLFVGLGLSIVLTVVPVREVSVVIPENTSLAEPSRRAIAGLIDLALLLGAGVAVGAVPAEQMWSTQWWMSAPGLLTLLAGLGLAGVGGGVCEWFTGRTPGKFLTGCRVVTVRPIPGDLAARPSLGQSLVRSIIKWCLPPVGLLAVFDPTGRPRADQIARTAVVVASAADEPDDE
ncbi:MAG: RDD family protein [Planctomycetota bacterium]|nr:RDD family protein [Planctomycetota bacterium]